MGGAIDTLQILIEADATGLTSQLQKAGTQIESFVSSMNDEEINWTQVLSKNLTPALLASIASTFAIAITQALQFQNAVTNASQSAGTAFGNSQSQMSDSALAFSEQTGASATDTADAMGIIGQTFKDTADAQAVLNTVTEEAQIKGTSVAQMATILVPLFKEWGLSGADTAQAMAVLNTSVAAGSIPFDTLVSSLTDVGPSLKGVTDIQHAASEAELASVQPGMDAATTLNTLKVAAQNVQNPLSTAGVLFGNLGKVIKTEGLGAAFADMAQKIQSAGAAAQVLYSQTGLAADSISHLQTTSVPALAAVDAESLKLIASSKDLNAQWSDSLTITKKLTIAWNEFLTALLKYVVPPIFNVVTEGMNALTKSIQAVNALVQDPNGMFAQFSNQDFWNTLGTNLQKTGNYLTSLETLGASGPISSWANSTVDQIAGGAQQFLGTHGVSQFAVPAPQLVKSTPTQNSQNMSLLSAPINSSTPGEATSTINVYVTDSSGNPQRTGTKISDTVKQTLHNSLQR